MLEDFLVLKGEAWRGATADAPDQAQQLVSDALTKYQARSCLNARPPLPLGAAAAPLRSLWQSCLWAWALLRFAWLRLAAPPMSPNQPSLGFATKHP